MFKIKAKFWGCLIVVAFTLKMFSVQGKQIKTMAQATKNKNFLTLSTPLGDTTFTLSSFKGVEKISNLFEFELDLFSDNNSIGFDSLIAKKGTIKIDLGDGTTQQISGIFGRIEQVSTPPKNYQAVTKYKAWIYPKLWLLKFSSNCKIFQNKTPVDIITEILGEGSITYSDKTQSCGKNQLEFCVQYNESNFNFISRLMEEAGIFYYFQQGEGGETLVLADSTDASESCPNVDQVKIMYGAVTQPFLMSMVECRLVQRVIPASNKLVDYSYQTPSTQLSASQSGPENAYGGNVYNYPGGFQQQTDGDTLAKLRLESQEMLKEVVEGISTIPFFMTGYTFELSNHPRSSLNEKYTLYEIRHEGRIVEEFDANGMALGNKLSYQNKFVGVPASTPIRPPLVTPKPRIFGTQTAKVTGKEGEEIFTEDLGRIKVKFHWDQSEANDDTTSCWIRVSYPWAGQQWGFLSTPRVGQEVVVAFLDGDPDFPIVVGSVYNGENKPPYLPDKTAQSGIKSNSSKGGGGSNEFRFDDTKGSEEVYFHAQKDYNKVVEHDETVKIVGGSRTITLEAQSSSESGGEGGGESEGGGEGGGEGEGGGGGGSPSIGGSYNDSLTLNNGNKTVKIVKGNYEITLDEGNMTITMSSGDMTIKATGNITFDATENITINAGADISMEAGADISISAGAAIEAEATTDISISAGTDITEEAGGAHSIEAAGDINRSAAGAISDEAAGDIEVSAAGAIEISAGGDVAVSAGGAAELTGGGDVAVSGGGACELTGGGTATLTGATVEITGALITLT